MQKDAAGARRFHLLAKAANSNAILQVELNILESMLAGDNLTASASQESYGHDWFTDKHHKEVLQLITPVANKIVSGWAVEQKANHETDILLGQRVQLAYRVHRKREKAMRIMKRSSVGEDKSYEYCTLYPATIRVSVCESSIGSAEGKRRRPEEEEAVSWQNADDAIAVPTETNKGEEASVCIEDGDFQKKNRLAKRSRLTRKKATALNVVQSIPEVESENRSDVTPNLKKLSLDQLKQIFERTRPYLRSIYKGRTPCVRHDAFKSGGRTRRDLDQQVYFGSFREEQVNFLMDQIKKFMGEPHLQYVDYNLRVLLPETLVQIVMHAHAIDYKEAEMLLRE